MSTLKDKPLKKCHTDKRKMIDDIHSEIIQNLDESEINSYYLDNGVNELVRGFQHIFSLFFNLRLI